MTSFRKTRECLALSHEFTHLFVVMTEAVFFCTFRHLLTALPCRFLMTFLNDCLARFLKITWGFLLGRKHCVVVWKPWRHLFPKKNLIFKSLCTWSGENFSRASKMAAIVGRLFHKKGRLALHARLGKKKSILLPGTKPLRSIHVNIIIRHLPDGFVAGQRVELSADASWLLLLLGWMRWNFSYRLLCLRQSGDAA